MLKKTYDQIKDIQDYYWFYNNRRFLLSRYLKRINNNSLVEYKPLKILDLGCATGSMLPTLQSFGKVIGLDMSHYALTGIKETQSLLIQSNAAHLPFKEESFDVVVLFDLLYHKDIIDESEVLSQIHRILKKNGSILITDSAFKKLYGAHDKAAQGARRFNKKDIVKLLTRNNYKIVHFTYNYMFLFPIVWINRKLLTRTQQQDKDAKLEFKKVNFFLNAVYSAIFNLEFILARFIPLPVGETFSCWGKK